MVDTNQDTADKKDTVKKKKEPPKRTEPKTAAKTATKTKGEDQGIVKKLPIRKELSPAKGQAGKPAPAAAKNQSFSLDNIKKFLKGALAELKKVHWPNKRELVSFTIVVLVAVILVSVMIFAVDSVLSKVLEAIIKK